MRKSELKSPAEKKISDLLIIFLALISVSIHLLVINNLEYHRDELLYFSLGQHPAFGYATVPPMIGWIACLMQNLFGYSLFAVRLLPALISGAMIFLAASMAKELGGSGYASFLAALGLLISNFFLRTFSLYMPVFMELFLWTLCIYLIIKYINSKKDKFLIIFGVIAGFALLNKYLVGLLFAGLIVIMPFTEYRKVFRKKMFWAGLAAGFVIFLPNFIWQASKGFPVFHHIKELYGTQLVHVNIPLFITEQLLMPITGTIFTIAGIIFLLLSKKVKKFKFLGFLSIFIIAGLMILKGKSYYTLGIFPLLIISGAVAYGHWIKKAWLRVIFPIILVLLTLPVLPFGIPIYNQNGLIKYFKVLDEKYGIDVGRRFEDGSIHSLPQDYADMLGWEELTSLANKAYQMVPEKKSCFIYCENYGQAGAITVIGKKYNLPEAVCFSESFRYWIPQQFVPDPTSFIYINDELGEDVNKLFRKITNIGSISNPDAREFGTTVYLCQDPVISFNEFWTNRLKNL
ncbi:MAG: glycosyltransferase family 39 protein [Bacteroidia bacterium]|nr:glycosyltransferase family 39 protein [Bacteroidia bacterium]